MKRPEIKPNWDGEGYEPKQACRALVAESLARLPRPGRLFGFPGTKFAFEKYLHEKGIPLEISFGLENKEGTLIDIRKAIKTLPEELQKTVEVHGGDDRDAFFSRSALRQHIPVGESFDVFFLDYMGSYKNALPGITGLCQDTRLHEGAFKRNGYFDFYIVVAVANKDEDQDNLKLLRTKTRNYPGKITPPRRTTRGESESLQKHYERAQGTHLDIVTELQRNHYEVEPLHAVYYRNNKPDREDPEKSTGGGTIMLFMGWRVYPAKDGIIPTMPAPLEPVFLGIENHKEIPHTYRTVKRWIETGIYQPSHLCPEANNNPNTMKTPSPEAHIFAPLLNPIRNKVAQAIKQINEAICVTSPKGEKLISLRQAAEIFGWGNTEELDWVYKAEFYRELGGVEYVIKGELTQHAQKAAEEILGAARTTRTATAARKAQKQSTTVVSTTVVSKRESAGEKLTVKDLVLQILKKAKGAPVHNNEIAAHIGRSKKNLSVWYATAGKKIPGLTKPEPGYLAYNPKAA